MQSIKLLGFITAILFLTVVIAGCDANAPRRSSQLRPPQLL